MERTLTEARARMAADPDDVPAALALADVLLRRARVETDGALALEAEQVLKGVLDSQPGEYTALRMLGATYLSQHRFLEAREIATRAIAARPGDGWNFGVLGDALIELGEYEAGFDAYDTMVRLRPDASAYARIAHAQELQGRLRDALNTMRRAAEATGAHDPESQAWHYAQLGHLHLELGEIDAARREYARADYVFPGHPYAQAGLARVAAARGDYPRALAMYTALLERAPTPELAAAAGDLMAMTGDAVGAGEMYARAETLEREGWETEAPQMAALARMLAERGLKTADAVALAEQAAATRRDIFTEDALAWSYYRAGRYAEAAGASERARRTGTSDRRILYHAAAIAHARGHDDEARTLLSQVLDGARVVDVSIAAGAAELSAALAGTQSYSSSAARR